MYGGKFKKTQHSFINELKGRNEMTIKYRTIGTKTYITIMYSVTSSGDNQIKNSGKTYIYLTIDIKHIKQG